MIHLLKAEYKKSFIELKTYYPDQIVDIIIKYFLFVAFFVGFGKSQIDVGAFYIGYLYWMIASYIIAEASASISFEKQVGTIEQIFLKPVSVLQILTLWTFVMFSISVLKFGILFLIVSLTLKITFTVTPAVLLIFLISIIGFTGIGIGLSGLTLLFAKTASFESIVSYGLLLISGTVISYQNMPDIIFKIIRILPFVLEIDISQKVLKTEIISIPDFFLVLLSNVAMFCLGCLVFQFFLKRVKRYGVMNKY